MEGGQMARPTDAMMPALPLAAAGKVLNARADDAIADQKHWGLIQDPNEGHFRINSVERAPATVINVPASKVGEVSGTVSDALRAESLDGGGGKAGDTAVSTVGGSVLAATPVGTASVAEPV